MFSATDDDKRADRGTSRAGGPNGTLASDQARRQLAFPERGEATGVRLFGCLRPSRAETQAMAFSIPRPMKPSFGDVCIDIPCRNGRGGDGDEQA